MKLISFYLDLCNGHICLNCSDVHCILDLVLSLVLLHFTDIPRCIGRLDVS